MNAPASITITPVRVADLLAEGERMPVYVHVIDHPDARVLVDTAQPFTTSVGTTTSYTSSGLRPSPFSIAFSRFWRFSSRKWSASTLGSPICGGAGSSGGLARQRSSRLFSQVMA
jgi:hypothetical protein